jgi:hyaluronoglucosaminidase
MATTILLLVCVAAISTPHLVGSEASDARQGELYSVFWDAVQPDCVYDKDCSNTPVDVTKYSLKGTNWTQTAANRWDAADHSGGPGVFPQLLNNGTALFGGVPQAADIPKLMAQLKVEVEAWIPDPDWSGNAVFDFEAYVPAWDLAEPPYRDYSLALVRKAHPAWNASHAVAVAKREFEGAATKMFVTALETAKSVRPKAYWGFYDMPRAYCPHCNYSEWFGAVVDASTAVYPSCYLQLPTKQDSPPEGNVPADMQAVIREMTLVNFNTTILETVKLAKRTGGNKPVYPFVSMFNLHASWTINGTKYIRKKISFMSDADATVEYLLPYSLGANGVVVWSGLGEKNALDHDSQDNATFWANFRGQAGPMTKAFMTEVEVCSKAHCSGHGRCMPYGSTQCQCFAGRFGPHCAAVSYLPSAPTSKYTNINE